MSGLVARPDAGDNLVLRDGDLVVEVARRGGELWRIAWRGIERLWHGDPAFWNYRAPILFPVIGRSPLERVAFGGDTRDMMLHGFARDLPFTVASRDASGVVLTQQASATTRRHYPFDYRLEMTVALAGDEVRQATTVVNAGDAPMPFCFGYHPGFVWPFEPGDPRDGHVVRFAEPQPDPVLRADLGTGLVRLAEVPTPVVGRELTLEDALFVPGAVMFPRPRSREVWYGRPGSPGLRVRFPDSPQLAVWTKPGAPYVCIEPWQGLAAAEGAGPEMTARPFVRMLAPGERATYRLEVAFGAAG